MLRTCCLFFGILLSVCTPAIAQEFWEPTGGPVGARGVIVGNSAGESFLSVYGSELYKYDAQQQSWNALPLPPLTTNRERRFVPTTAAGNLFAYVEDEWRDWPRMLLRSADGITWDTLADPYYEVLSTIHEAPGGRLVAAVQPNWWPASSPGLLISDNDGASWTISNSGMEPNAGVHRLAVSSDGTLYAAANGDIETDAVQGFYKSYDSGTNWILVPIGEELHASVVDVVVSQQRIIASIWHGGPLISDDQGDTWHAFGEGLPAGDYWYLVLDEDGWLYTYGSEPGVYRRGPEDPVWLPVLEAPPSSAGHWFNTSHGLWVLPYDRSGPVLSTDRGETWSVRSNHLVHSDVDRIIAQPSGILLAMSDVVYRSWNQGGSWHEVYPAVEYMQHTPAGIILLQNYDGTLVRSMDDGSNWTELPRLHTELHPFTVTQNGTLLAGDTLYRSTDDGETWQLVSTGIQYHRSAFLLSTPDGTVFSFAYLRHARSLDNGATWTEIGDGTPLEFLHPYAAAVGPDGTIYVANDEVLRSDDNGETWIEINSGLDLDLEFFQDLVATPAGELFLCGFHGFYRSTDRGDTWESVGAELYSWINDLELARDGHLYAATWNNGVVRSADVISSSPKSPVEVFPQRLTLYQNYPNPFNPTTTLSFDLPSQQPVVLSIHNLLGQQIETLLDGTLSAGSHVYNWDASDYPSGMYFCRLSAPASTQTRKLMLLK